MKRKKLSSNLLEKLAFIIKVTMRSTSKRTINTSILAKLVDNYLTDYSSKKSTKEKSGLKLFPSNNGTRKLSVLQNMKISDIHVKSLQAI